MKKELISGSSWGDRMKLKLIGFWLNRRRFTPLILFLCRSVALSGPGGRIRVFLKDHRDLKTFREVFLQKEYEVGVHVQPRFIVDLGANIGLSVAYFYLNYPDCHILAIEPDPRAFILLRKVCSQDRRLRCLNLAVAGKTGTLSLHVTNTAISSSLFPRKGEIGTVEVECQTFSDLVKDISEIDILKIDVEGSEQYVLSDPAIQKTNIIIGEVHPDLIETPAVNLLDGLKNFSYETRPLALERFIFTAVKSYE